MEQVKKVLPLIPLRGFTIFPGMVMHFDVGRKMSVLALEEAMKNDQYIFLSTQKDSAIEEPSQDQISKIGTMCSIKQLLKLPGESVRVLVQCEKRIEVCSFVQEKPYIKIEANIIEEKFNQEDNNIIAGIRVIKDLFKQYIAVTKVISKEVLTELKAINNPSEICDKVASYLELEDDQEQEILETIDINKRKDLIIDLLKSEIDITRIQKKLSQKVKKNMDKVQKEYYLKEQIKAIQEELGQEDDDKREIKRYKAKINRTKMTKEAKAKALHEINRLKSTGASSAEGGVIKTYLDVITEIPWLKSTEDNLDVNRAEEILNEEHFGLDDVKKRILEYLAVRSVSKSLRAPILCFVGPPGVGKTSIAKSIAKSINKSFQRISLGGISDEADIRGHRKTYIGAMPGRIIDAVIKAKSNNPLLLLDEIDKVSSSYKGNPSDALLEVLDGEQNSTFRDHYLELDFDLSKTMFVTTANSLDTIPRPLLDRMEVIEVSGYTIEEKFNIAKKYLIAKELKEHEIEDIVSFSDKSIYYIIEKYTRESGVRNLERCIAKVIRNAIKEIVSSKKKSIHVSVKHIVKYLGTEIFEDDKDTNIDKIGVVNGMAWTAYGGTTLPVEALSMPGTGKLVLTGKLGEVMQESAKASYSYIRANAQRLGVSDNFYKNKDIHIHCPEGAVPKDGPSAGVTITTALVSALSEKKVRANVAMTGEITLTGRVLAIGGLKEKILAASRYGIDTIIIPKQNSKDLIDIPKNILNKLTIIEAEEVATVLENAIIGDE